MEPINHLHATSTDYRGNMEISEPQFGSNIISETLAEKPTLKFAEIKALVCEKLSLKKMGEARWEMILQYGERASLFFVNRDKKTISKSADLPILTPPPKTEDEQDDSSDETRDEYGFTPKERIKGTRLLKISATRPREPAEFILNDGARPLKQGDVVWVSTQGTTWQGEIKSVTQGAVVYPLDPKDGYWGYFKADELFDTQAQARVNQDVAKPKYWSASAMSSKDYALFKEYEENREAFLKWKETQETQTQESEDDPFDGLFD